MFLTGSSTCGVTPNSAAKSASISSGSALVWFAWVVATQGSQAFFGLTFHNISPISFSIRWIKCG